MLCHDRLDIIFWVPVPVWGVFTFTLCRWGLSWVVASSTSLYLLCSTNHLIFAWALYLGSIEVDYDIFLFLALLY
jgi:hypothetical protein